MKILWGLTVLPKRGGTFHHPAILLDTYSKQGKGEATPSFPSLRNGKCHPRVFLADEDAAMRQQLGEATHCDYLMKDRELEKQLFDGAAQVV